MATSQKTSETSLFGNSAGRPTESTALAMKESHLFPAWWANPQETSETSVFGTSAAST